MEDDKTFLWDSKEAEEFGIKSDEKVKQDVEDIFNGKYDCFNDFTETNQLMNNEYSKMQRVSTRGESEANLGVVLIKVTC